MEEKQKDNVTIFHKRKNKSHNQHKDLIDFNVEIDKLLGQEFEDEEQRYKQFRESWPGLKEETKKLLRERTECFLDVVHYSLIFAISILILFVPILWSSPILVKTATLFISVVGGVYSMRSIRDPVENLFEINRSYKNHIDVLNIVEHELLTHNYPILI